MWGAKTKRAQTVRPASQLASSLETLQCRNLGAQRDGERRHNPQKAALMRTSYPPWDGFGTRNGSNPTTGCSIRAQLANGCMAGLLVRQRITSATVGNFVTECQGPRDKPSTRELGS